MPPSELDPTEGWPDHSALVPQCRFGHQLAVENGWCRQCSVCPICQKSLTPTEYFWCLREALKLDELPVFEHPGCFKEMDRLTLQSDSVRIPQVLFDKLNACRLLWEPLKDRNVKTNEQDADIQTQRLIHLSSQNKSYEEHMEDLYLTLRRLESASATISLAVSKARRAIEDDLQERDKENYQRAHVVREKQKVAAPNAVARTERKKLSKEDKAIAALVAVGVSLEDAKLSIAASKARKSETIQ